MKKAISNERRDINYYQLSNRDYYYDFTISLFFIKLDQMAHANATKVLSPAETMAKNKAHWIE